MGVAACVGRACVLAAATGRRGGGESACVACVAVVCGHLIKMLYKLYLYHSTREQAVSFLSDFFSLSAELVSNHNADSHETRGTQIDRETRVTERHSTIPLRERSRGLR